MPRYVWLHRLRMSSHRRAVTVLVTGNNPPKPSTTPLLAALAAKLALGAGLTLIAIRQYRKMDKPKPPKKTPKWQTTSTT